MVIAPYKTVDGEDGKERRLRAICSGESLTTYIAGNDFTMKTISRYSNGKTYAIKMIWDMGLDVYKFLKKSLSLLPRLSHIISVDKTAIITNFASGKMEKNFYDKMYNGMYSINLANNRACTGEFSKKKCFQTHFLLTAIL
jgi:hypothetical protein